MKKINVVIYDDLEPWKLFSDKFSRRTRGDRLSYFFLEPIIGIIISPSSRHGYYKNADTKAAKAEIAAQLLQEICVLEKFENFAGNLNPFEAYFLLRSKVPPVRK